MEDDLEGLRSFRDCLNSPTGVLSNVDLMYNRIGESVGLLLCRLFELMIELLHR
jgi:hypothetical protein